MATLKLAPHTLVRVEADNPLAEGWKYAYVGEVMSFVTPEKTVMVRRVPMHPGTLDEVPIERISRPLHPCRYIHYAEIKGFGSLPWDMLRYDNAAPVNFRATKEYPYWEFIPTTVEPEEKRILIACVNNRAKWPWTVDRWRSFMWTVTPVATERWRVQP